MKCHDYESKDDTGDALERDDALWDLLGEARPVEVSQLFSRNVVRQLRIARQHTDAIPFGALLTWWRPVLFGAAGLAVVAVNGVLMTHRFDTPSAPHPRVSDAETIEHLDELLAYEPTEVWLDKSVY